MKSRFLFQLQGILNSVLHSLSDIWVEGMSSAVGPTKGYTCSLPISIITVGLSCRPLCAVGGFNGLLVFVAITKCVVAKTGSKTI